MNTLMACLSQSLVRKRTHEGELGWSSCSSSDEGFKFNGLKLNLGIHDDSCCSQLNTGGKRICRDQDWIFMPTLVSVDQENKEIVICDGAESGKIEKRGLGANGFIDLNLDQALVCDENMVVDDDGGLVDVRVTPSLSPEGLSGMGEGGKQREGEQGVSLSAGGIFDLNLDPALISDENMVDDDDDWGLIEVGVTPLLSLGGLDDIGEGGKQREGEQGLNFSDNGIDLNLGPALKSSDEKLIEDDRKSVEVRAVDDEFNLPFLSLDDMGIDAGGVEVSEIGERSNKERLGNLGANGVDLNLGLAMKNSDRKLIDDDRKSVEVRAVDDEFNLPFLSFDDLGFNAVGVEVSESGERSDEERLGNLVADGIDLNLDQVLKNSDGKWIDDDRNSTEVRAVDDEVLPFLSLGLGISAVGVKVSESGEQSEKAQFGNLAANGIDLNLGQAQKNSDGKPIDDNRNSVEVHAVDDEVLPFLTLGLGINAGGVKVKEIGKQSEKERSGNFGANGNDLNLGQALQNSDGKSIDNDRNSVEVHAVDDEVCPFLGLGLGINAVGVKVSVSGERSGESQFRNLGANGIDLNLSQAQNCESLGNNEILIDDDDQDVTVQNMDTSCVRAWLSQLGFSEYATVFEFHGVDDEVLPFLSLEDLKDMGISEVGTRRKMYGSIKRLAEELQLRWREK